MPDLRRYWKDWAVLAVTLVVASLALRWSLVGLGLQLKVLGIVLVATCAGVFVASLPRVTYPDAVLFALVAFVVGVVLLSTSAFVLAHSFLFGGVPLAAQPERVWWGFAVIGLLGLAGAWKLRRPHLLVSGAFDARVVAILLALATAVSVYVQIGFHDGSGVKVSGVTYSDRVAHIIDYPNQILASGLPLAPFQHFGVELMLLQFQGMLGGPGLSNRIAAYKLMSLAFYFVVAYATYAIARHGSGATRRLSVVAGLASLIFGAIYPIPWAFGDLSRSSYLGMYSPSGSFYHNATQLFGHGVATVGVALLGIAWRQRLPLIGLGCVLIAASTFFKPSFIFTFGPALFAIVPLLYLAGRLNRDLVLGLVALVLAPLAWIIYPLVMHVDSVSNTFIFQPFAFSAYYIPRGWPDPLLRMPLGLAAFVIVVAFAFPIVTVALALADRKWRESGPLSHPKQWLASHPFEVLIAVFFGLSVVIGIALVQPNGLLGAGDLTWSALSAYLCAMPGLLQLSTRLSSRTARLLLWGVFAWHVLSGLRLLIRFVVLGQL